MNIGTPQLNAKLMRLAIIVSIVSSAFSAFLLFKLNGIVHGQLYDFGLQFSLSWASPYWTFERLIYACLIIPSIIGGLALAHGFLLKGKNVKPPVKEAEANHAVSQVQVTRDNSMMISCPKCRKVFGRPLSMLDFSTGTTQLVNVCPYCNQILGTVAETDSSNTRVMYPGGKEIKQK